ncbi:integrin beta-nu [Anopheles bellator]|uniref:integrin beta-nu n=1 Tax=Anopheles bellator TaxID=139047 RepID=UPI00264762CB|nr:integrin beta-nu [Anopheles bellator]
MSTKRIISLLVMIAVLNTAFGQIARLLDPSKCFFQTNCIDCLDIDKDCAWCTDEFYEMRKSRCMPKHDLLISNCNASKIETNENYYFEEITHNAPHRDFDAEKLEAVQITPQKMRIRLGKLSSRSFSFKYKPANNYPLDMYYLMDLTWSMRDDKATLEKMGSELALALANLTANYRLGFGSFADKPAVPFIQTEPHRLANPCYSESDQCEPTYGFRHHLRITNDIESFIAQVKQSSVTGNIDNLEGGLDALMQVLVCENQIGWGNNTRKIVVVATDGWLHMAGDGLLAGIIRENDKQCHLSADGNFVDVLKYDYPSLEQIWRVLLRSKTAVIFAVTEEQESYYKRLRELMPEFTSVGRLQNDSSNILQLVKDGYREFVRRVEFTDNAPDYIDIRYTTDCGGMYTTPQPINRCENIEIGKEYRFNVEVRLLEYPKDLSVSDITVLIEEKLISNEAFELQINLRSTCDCEKNKNALELSELCSFHGDYVCGLCQCYAGWIGKTCECNLQNSLNRKELFEQCVAPTDKDELQSGPVCSDRGECVCGQCICNPGYTGDHCECTNCTIMNGMVCGGADHGVCACGKCSCYDSWRGDNCECSTETSTCKAPLSSALCSNHGFCDCGRCNCNETFFGQYCETKVGEQSTLCSHYEECVRCAVQTKNDLFCEDFDMRCREKIGLYKVDFVNTVNASHNCTFRFSHEENVCDYKYSYELIGNRLTLLKVQDIICKQVDLVTAGLTIAISIFVGGLMFLLCYQLKITYDDRRMFAKFEEEREQHTQYREQSPIYKSPISEFQVPPEMESTVL